MPFVKTIRPRAIIIFKDSDGLFSDLDALRMAKIDLALVISSINSPSSSWNLRKDLGQTQRIL